MEREASTFEELGYEPPYVEAYKKAQGHYPVLVLQGYRQLPVRYPHPGHPRGKFKMVQHPPGEKLSVTGTEPGKKVPVNILARNSKGDLLVLTPQIVANYCRVLLQSGSGETGTAVEKPHPTEAASVESLKEGIAQTRARARWAI